MKSTAFICLMVVLLGGGVVGTISLRRHNDLRRMQVSALRLRAEAGVQAARRAEESRATSSEAPGVRARAGASAVEAVGSTEPTKLRAEITALEKRAEEEAASRREVTDAPATNRDPEKGMTKLEYFQNAGQATPAAAFQTMVWAALKGEDKIMAQTIGLDAGAREKVRELIAGLPESAREKYPTPESVFALFLSKALVQVSSIEIADTEQKDPSSAILTVRGLMGNDQKLPMRLSAGGWQLWENEKNAEWLKAEFKPEKKD